MAKIYDSVLELSGQTPLVRLSRLEADGTGANLYGKLESVNPTRSTSDRGVWAILQAEERNGQLTPGGEIILADSGNAAISAAQWATIRGYSLTVVLPGDTTREKRTLLGGYGVPVLTTPREQGIEGAKRRAKQLAQERDNAYLLELDSHPLYSSIHEATTGPELWEGLDGALDVLVVPEESQEVAQGAGAYLKAQNPAVQIVVAAKEPSAESSKEAADRVVPVSDEEAGEAAARLAKREGILAGIPAGRALEAALNLAQQPEYQGKNLVIFLPDTGERYLSTGIYGEILAPIDPF
jgi:cysteine synthase A